MGGIRGSGDRRVPEVGTSRDKQGAQQNRRGWAGRPAHRMVCLRYAPLAPSSEGAGDGVGGRVIAAADTGAAAEDDESAGDCDANVRQISARP